MYESEYEIISKTTLLPIAYQFDYLTLRSTISQSTGCNFKYVINTGTTNEWALYRPRNDGTSGTYYFKIYENASNTSQANNFMSNVNTLSNKEAAYYAAATATVVAATFAGFMVGFATGTAGALAPAAIAAIVAAAGAAGAAAVAGQAVGTQCNNCMYAIDNVYYATNNMHF
jgi:hypothetical protein